MPELIYTRRIKADDPSMVEAFSTKEVYEYFKDEAEWKLASKLYWERFNIGNGHYRRPVGVTGEYYNYLLNQYKKFQNHKYSFLKKIAD